MAFKKFTKKPRVYKKKASKPSKSLTKAIQSVVRKDVENKEAYHGQSLLAMSPDIAFSTDILRILPNIPNGVDSNNRIGVKVRALTLKVKGHMVLSTLNNTLANSRIAVRMIIVQPKLSSYFDVVSGATFGNPWLAALLQKGGASVPYTGTISDLYAPIDKDNSIVMYDKIFYLSVPINLAQPSSSVVATTIKFFTFTKKLNKVLQYVDALNSLQPQNCSPVLLFGYTALDGTAPNVAQTQVSIAYDSTLSYEDA